MERNTDELKKNIHSLSNQLENQKESVRSLNRKLKDADSQNSSLQQRISEEQEKYQSKITKPKLLMCLTSLFRLGGVRVSNIDRDM